MLFDRARENVGDDPEAGSTEIERTLRAHFWKSSPSIKWAGSMAKGTMIRESYDGDMTAFSGD